MRYLCRRGLKPVTRNFRCRFGEIDLILRDADTLVFVEVRYRSSSRYGQPQETVTPRKQARMIAAAAFYLAGTLVNSPTRFDVVALTQESGQLRIQWIANAFTAI